MFGSIEPKKPVFEVTLVMKSGASIKKRFHKFSVRKNVDNTIAGLEWELEGPEQLLFISLDQIALISSCEVR